MKTVKSKYVLTKNGCFKSIIVRNYKVSNALLLDDNDGKFIKNIRLYNEKLKADSIKNSINKRFKVLLELIASVCESDEDPGSGLMFALNEIERFKRELINKYVKLLKDEQIKFLDKKIKVVEEEVKTRMLQYAERMSKDYSYSEREVRRR